MSKWITVEKAADILNVSTLYVYGLINSRELGLVNGRLLDTDVIEFKMGMEAACDKAVAELVEESERLGLYE